MAETVASALFNVIFEKLTDEAMKKFVRSQKIQSEINELQITLSQVKALLNDASHKEISQESVGLWLNRLQHLAYDIDDILDDVATKAMHRELTQDSGTITSKVRNLIPTCCTNISLSERLSSKLDSINRELQGLEKQKADLGLIVRDEKPKNSSRRNETSLPDASSVVGRKGEIEELRNKLLSDGPSEEKFSIVPIVGMGGVGKTTLARLLFNDPQVDQHFELKAWVCVSDDFDIVKISDAIFQYVTRENKEENKEKNKEEKKEKNKEENKEKKDINQLQMIQMAVTEQFKEKRFLLVVDDVWSENYDDWENLVRPFHSGAHGSRIIMTTRNDQLLKKLGFHHLERLEHLSHEDALSLFALHALGVDNFDSHTTLKPHGERFVKKCDGLPLAIKAVGRLLRTKTYGDWEDVLNSEIWDIEDGKHIIPALKLSYHDLSADLKQLFAYCSLFPKDFLFNREELVLLWMAEGFLNPSNASKSPERLGLEYFEILFSRSFFQYAPNNESLFMMHDLMVDLATFVAGEFFLRLENHMNKGKEALANHRYMSFTRDKYVGYNKFEEFKRARNLRTMLAVYIGVDNDWGRFYLSNKILVDLLPELPLLRVLSLSCFEISEVPKFIGSLKHLRYLNLSKTEIEELPENVGSLYNLQSLIVFGCKSLSKLPKTFLKLKKLRHFDIRDTPLLKKLPFGIGELESLQTLSKIIIGGHDSLAINELKGLKNLQGKISIEGLNKVQSAVHAREANSSLTRITEIELQWEDVFDGSRSNTLENEVLNELEPNSGRLKELVIESYGGTRFSNWVGDPSFHLLVNVSIRGCRKCTSLPPFGQLSSLKELFIQGMDEVKVIGLEFSGTGDVAFPSLETLKFEDMRGWEVWSTNNKVVLPNLQKLCIKDCGSLVDISLTALPSLRVLDINKCGDGVLKSLVKAAGSSILELKIRSISGLTDEVWRGVVKHLGAVEDVTIKECNEIRYLWESEGEASKVLVNLKKLKVERCENLVSLGEKEEEEDKSGSNLLSSLRMLEISFCDSINTCFCPNSNSIERLKISNCESITCFLFPTIATAEGRGGQKLKSLIIDNCGKLTENINNASMPMLEVLDIFDWVNLKSIIEWSNCIYLTRLSISCCSSLESLAELSNLTFLKDLKIVKCPMTDYSFPCGVWPPNLCSLEIGGLEKPILELGLENLPASLVDLTIRYAHEVRYFSELTHIFPSSLTTLRIMDCDNLDSLSMGLQHLKSLQHLDIWWCPKMKHLPEALLPSLLSLRIWQCGKLSRRCKGRGSHYWPLISHIPYIIIY